VLRKADVPAAGAALGLDVPPRLRTMADIRALRRPWCLAVATGLLQVGGGSVSRGPALERWPPGDADLLAAWLTALRAVCAAESYPQDEDSVRLLAMALLAVLHKDGEHRPGGLWGPVHAALHDLCDRYDKSSWEPLHAADRYDGPETRTPLAGLVALLAEFGAVAGDRGKPLITPLGCWAAGHLAAGLPGLADPSLSASEMIAELARFGDEEQRDHVAWGWLAERQPAETAREILTAAEGMSPLLRVMAVGVVQQDKGPDEALSRVWKSMPGTDLDTCLAKVQATGHPDAAELSQEVGGVRRLRRAVQYRPGGRAEGLAVRLPSADLAPGAAAGHGHPRRPA
jgi:hypothetical protein